MAKGSWRLRITWLRIRSFPVCARAVDDGDADRRDDGDEPGDEAAQPGRQADVEEALHHDLAGHRRRHRRGEPAAEQRDAEERRRDRGAEQRLEQLLGAGELADVGVAAAVEGRRREDQDRGVDGQREHQRERRIQVAYLSDSRRSGSVRPIGAGLDDAGVQVEVVGHHRRAEDAHRQIEHVRVADDLGRRGEAADHLAPLGVGEGDLDGEAGGDDADQGDDEGLDPAEAAWSGARARGRRRARSGGRRSRAGCRRAG